VLPSTLASTWKAFGNYLNLGWCFGKITNCETVWIVLQVVQSEYSIPPPHGPGSAQLWKTAASLPSPVVEARGWGSENGRQLSWAETDHVFAVERRRYTVSYQQFVQGEHRPAVLSMFNWVWSVSSGSGTAPAAAL